MGNAGTAAVGVTGIELEGLAGNDNFNGLLGNDTVLGGEGAARAAGDDDGREQHAELAQHADRLLADRLLQRDCKIRQLLV